MELLGLNFINFLIYLLIFLKLSRQKINVLYLITLIYILCFSLNPIYNYFYPYSRKVSYVLITSGDMSYYFTSLLTIISYFFVLFGYRIKQRRKKIRIYSFKKFKKFIVIIFIIGVIINIVYFLSIGGVYNAIKYAELYRLGRGPITSKIMFLKYLCPILLYSSIGIYMCYLEKKEKKWKFLFVISLIFSILFLLHDAGRYIVLTYILGLFLYKYNIYGLTKKEKILLSTLGILILYGDTFFSYILTGYMTYTETKVVEKIIREFAFPYYNISNAIARFDQFINQRFFIDIPLGFIYILPSKIFGKIELLQPLTYLNSKLYKFKSGNIPIDLISYGYYNMRVTGVIIISILYGFIAKKIDLLGKIKNNYFGNLIHYIIIIYFPFRIIYGDILMILQHGISIIIVICIYKFYIKRLE